MNAGHTSGGESAPPPCTEFGKQNKARVSAMQVYVLFHAGAN